MPRITVKYLVNVRDKTGTGNEDLELPEGASLQDAADKIREPEWRRVGPVRRGNENATEGKRRDPAVSAAVWWLGAGKRPGIATKNKYD